MIEAKVICDSINYLDKRLTTLILTYPRYIHSEFMTHRVLSKNSASSRAIPISKFIKDINEMPVEPMWTLNEPGMQGQLITNEDGIQQANQIWIEARDSCCKSAQQLSNFGIHKQNVNRLLEPFLHMRVICTGTDWENFFELRDHKDAMPEIQTLAREIRSALRKSIPQNLKPGEWHIPFGDRIDEDVLMGKVLYEDGFVFNPGEYNLNSIKIATARCARISYMTQDGKIDYQKDIALANRLYANNPKHLSPTEHIAKCPQPSELVHFDSHWTMEDDKFSFKRGKYVSNLNGWIQYRKIVESENS